MNGGWRLFPGSLAVALAFPAQAAAQEGAIAGRVTDMETGAPAASASVQVLGRGATTALTDASGEFRLAVPAGRHSLLVTLIGYESARTDGVTVEAGAVAPVAIELRSRALVLNQLVVTVSRREEKELDAPASVSTLTNQQISRIIAPTPADHVRTLPGVDLASTGLTQSYAVVRGFNNVASGRLLSIVDNRYARIPALRINAINMIPTTDMDIERIELARGPGAALYGPNAAEGVMHIITYSPIDRPGTTVSLGGGERSVVQFLLRSAHAVSDRFGFKVSGQYLRGKDWEYEDPWEVQAREEQPDHPRIGVRNPLNERFFGDLRADYRFADEGEFIVSGGLNKSLSSINLTTVGSAQTHDWQYRYAQTRLLKGRFFGQFFLNQTHSGDNSYLLRSGDPIVDRSRIVAAQLQHGFDPGERQSFTYGIDWQRIEPRSQGTIYGRNEDDDILIEAGTYLHSETRLGDRFDLVTALRFDDHNRLTGLELLAAGRPRLSSGRRPEPAPDVQSGLCDALHLVAVLRHQDGQPADRAGHRLHPPRLRRPERRVELFGPVSRRTHGLLHALALHAGPAARERRALLGCAGDAVRSRTAAPVPDGPRESARRPGAGHGLPPLRSQRARCRGRRHLPARPGT